MKILPFLVIFCVFLFVTMYLTYPLIFNLTDTISETQDAVLITWILNWNIHSFTHNILSIFNANIYYPYLHTLAYSDTLFISSILAYIPVKITGEPLTAYNFNIILSSALLGFCTYLLSYYFTKNHLSALVSGCITAFSPYTLSKHMHLQIVSIWWVPLSLLFLLKYIDQKKFYFLTLTGLCLVLQLANSILPAYFLLLCYAAICIYIVRNNKKDLSLFFNKKAFILYFFLFFVSIPLVLPYVQVSKEFQYVRDIRDTIHFANRPEYTFYPSDRTRLQSFILSTIYENDTGPFKYDGYIGSTFFILLFISLLYRYCIYKKSINRYFDLFLSIGFFSFILSLGPVFQWGGKVVKHPFMIPLPYALLYYLMPGFKGFRNSARWEMLMLIMISVAISIFLQHLSKSIPKRLFTAILLIICLLVIAECNVAFRYYSVPKKAQFPPVYLYISSLPQGAVIELPWYNWNMQPYAEVEKMRMYYSTLHFYPMVNGSSGFSPPPWQEKELWFGRNFPNEETINYLKQIKVKYVILHAAEYDTLSKDKFSYNQSPIPTSKQMRERINSYKDLQLIKVLKNDYVYQIE